MLSLGSGGAKGVKPSFVSYITPEEIKLQNELQRTERYPDFLPGEVVFCSANPILKHSQDDLSQRGIFGTLLCTNFRVSFISDEMLPEELIQVFSNKLYRENDIPLTCVDQVFGVYDEKKRLVTCSTSKNKYPSKMIIHCKDLRVFQFCLTFAKEEDARKIFQGIVHHCLEPKSLRCVYAFSYAARTSAEKHATETVLFDTKEDWIQEMKRTKGKCSVVTSNENFTLSTALPKYFIVPAAVTDDDLAYYPGNGLPIWCWSHYSGCALFKASSIPVTQEDGVLNVFMERMLEAVAQNHLYSVKTEDLSATLPTIQDIQQSYTRFKQLFLIDSSTEFWMSDVKWFSSLENSGWLDIIRQCLQKAVEVVECLEKENTNVLLIEDGGTDLCCLISSLVQIMIDPHPRTILGFQGLVQKEWVAGCHAFLDRCNHLYQKDKESQSPVFLLFLECVWQLLQQHRTAFQFTETYLTVLSDSINVPLFDTFLFNTAHHREITIKNESQKIHKRLLSCPEVWDWSLQFDYKAQQLFLNPLYTEKLRRNMRRVSRAKWQVSSPSSAIKTPPKKGFFKDETENLKKLLRVSRWKTSLDSPTAGPAHEFYNAWLRHPHDGLLLPCPYGPGMQLWTQRYLRWIPESHIPGGGAVTVLRKLAEVLGHVQELQRELEYKDYLGKETDCHKLQPELLTQVYTSLCMSSSFPFAAGRNSYIKPAIPTSLPHSLLVNDTLASQEDECNEMISLV